MQASAGSPLSRAHVAILKAVRVQPLKARRNVELSASHSHCSLTQNGTGATDPVLLKHDKTHFKTKRPQNDKLIVLQNDPQDLKEKERSLASKSCAYIA